MPSAASRQPEIVVETGEASIDALCRLSEAVYGPHPDMSSGDYHRWLYTRNPLQPAIQASAFDSGTMIGHYAVVPLRFADENGEFLAGLGVNALVHPQAEGRGLFARLVSAADARAAAAGIEMHFVVSGPQSEPWFTTVLRYSKDGELSLFVEPLRARGFNAAGILLDPLLSVLGRVANRTRRTSGLRIASVPRYGPEFDDLWKRVRSSLGRTTLRSAQYLNWRYAQCPTREYRSIAAWSGERVVAHVVSRVRSVRQFSRVRLGSIVDVTADGTPEGRTAAAALIAQACRSLRDDGCDAVIAQLRVPSPLAPLLRRNGLWRIPGKHAGYRPIAFKGRSSVAEQAFHFMGGDFDMG